MYLAAVSIMLRHHGMNDDSLRHVYKAVVLSKLLYASSAWWEFTCVADWQRLEASIRRAVRSGFYASDEPSMSQLVEDTDDKLTISGTTLTTFYINFCQTRTITHTIFDLVDILFP